MARGDQYRDLLDSPKETLAVEYKSWLDLSDNKAKADLARHIAAISNHGGGMIVFGFNDTDLSYSGKNPHESTAINRDTVSSIVKKYLEPTFQCDVEQVESAAGNIHPVIVVPSHGSTPICSKASGPQTNGKPEGIANITYYIRKPGPESAEIITATEWVPVIRRCALHEKANILNAISIAIAGEKASTTPDRTSDLKNWHETAFKQFQSDVKDSNAPNSIIERNVQWSYMIIQPGQERLDLVDLRDTGLLQMNNEVKDRVRTGWSMIHPFTRQDIAPRIVADEESGDERSDFLECAFLRVEKKMEYCNDLWRVSPDGKVTLIRSYEEDDSAISRNLGVIPGAGLSPDFQCRAVAEIVRHAQAFVERFETAESVLFRCQWRGLRGRTIVPVGAFSIPGESSTDFRITTAEVPIGSLATEWPKIVSDLVAPVIRLFNGSFQVTPSYVRSRAPTWLR